MKCDSKVFKKWLNKFKMCGNQQINEALFKFEVDGIHATANSPSKQTRSEAILYRIAFDQYDAMSPIGLNDLEKLSKVLDRFSGKIDLTVAGNLLTIKGDNKKVEVELADEKCLEKIGNSPALNFAETFVMQSSTFKEVFEDVKLNKDAKILISTVPGSITFSNTGKYKFSTVKEIPTIKSENNVMFGEPLVDAMTNLDCDVTVSLKTNYPILIVEECTESKVSLLIAPRIDTE